MYLLYLWLLLQICNANNMHKCSNCKYFLHGKYQLNNNDNIQLTPEKCQLYFLLRIENQNIVQDYLDTTVCRKHAKLCGKDGKYFEPSTLGGSR